jgi:hypothetical protein
MSHPIDKLPPLDNMCIEPNGDYQLKSKITSADLFMHHHATTYKITKGKFYKVDRMQIVDMAIEYFFRDDTDTFYSVIDWFDGLTTHFSIYIDGELENDS